MKNPLKSGLKKEDGELIVRIFIVLNVTGQKKSGKSQVESRCLIGAGHVAGISVCELAQL